MQCRNDRKKVWMFLYFDEHTFQEISHQHDGNILSSFSDSVLESCWQKCARSLIRSKGRSETKNNAQHRLGSDGACCCEGSLYERLSAQL